MKVTREYLTSDEGQKQMFDWPANVVGLETAKAEKFVSGIAWPWSAIFLAFSVILILSSKLSQWGWMGGLVTFVSLVISVYLHFRLQILAIVSPRMSYVLSQEIKYHQALDAQPESKTLLLALSDFHHVQSSESVRMTNEQISSHNTNCRAALVGMWVELHRAAGVLDTAEGIEQATVGHKGNTELVIPASGVTDNYYAQLLRPSDAGNKSDDVPKSEGVTVDEMLVAVMPVLQGYDEVIYSGNGK